MATKTFNPYPLIGSQLIKGMDEIAKSLNSNSTEEDLAEVIYKYIQKIYYSQATTQLELEIKSIVFNIINAYNNQKVLGTMFNYQQMIFVDMLLGETTTDNTPINSLGTWLTDIEDNVVSSNLSTDQLTPLLLGIESGKNIYEYWLKKVNDPCNWKKFFQPELSQNYINIPYWLTSCIEGALVGASCSDRGLIAPTTDIVTVEIVSSLIGSLTLGAGKVIFRWVPRIQPNQLSGGFSVVIGETPSNILKEGSNSYCSNKRKCSNSGTNTCSNSGTCSNTCTNNCPIIKD